MKRRSFLKLLSVLPFIPKIPLCKKKWEVAHIDEEPPRQMFHEWHSTRTSEVIRVVQSRKLMKVQRGWAGSAFRRAKKDDRCVVMGSVMEEGAG